MLRVMIRIGLRFLSRCLPGKYARVCAGPVWPAPGAALCARLAAGGGGGVEPRLPDGGRVPAGRRHPGRGDPGGGHPWGGHPGGLRAAGHQPRGLRPARGREARGLGSPGGVEGEG